MYHIKNLLKKPLDYYYANKEIISNKNKNKYKSLSPKQKKKRQENSNSKQWFNRQSPEKQAELRQKVREYHKDRCHNLMVAVK